MDKRGVVIYISFCIGVFLFMMNGVIQANEKYGTLSSILYVGGSGPNNYTKIQYAIDNASNGDTIFVYSGIYYENVVVNKSLNLIGEDKNTTIIDASYAGSVIYIFTDHANISNFKINNSGYLEAGIYISSSNNTISNCNISNNGYGIYTQHSSSNTISNCNIHSNNDQGILVYYSSNITISNCNIYLNTNEGVVFYFSSSNTISNCNVYSNNEYGIYVCYSSNNTISNCNVSNNEYSMVLDYSNNSIITKNIVSDNNYGGIFIGNSINNHIYHNNLIDNNLNAYDIGNNTWDDGYPSGGNYWSDFDEPSEGAYDNNSDGIVDTPYNILGGSNVDRYPLMYQVGKFIIKLSKEWNLITLPCKNSYNASSLFNDIEGCSIILGWNANVQDFELYAPGVPYDFAIEDGYGYFIGMKNDSIFSLADVPVENVSIPLYIGWNMLGWFKENVTTASSIYQNITGCSIVLRWNASMQDFDLYAPGVPNDFVIARGEGFLVAVDEESEWHGEG
ncbi:MAG TPA: hypothetical protein ENI33_04925 [Thermoplasmatales archaeon]|nr:hypothetical protein [Thermoplasmatales archaeon]